MEQIIKHPITKRVDLNLGYSCNSRCLFCYYKKSALSPKDLTTAVAKARLRFFRYYGKEAIDFTGGEPTIREDIFELVSYAKKLRYKTICVITNGIVMAEKKFTAKLAICGVNDVLFSLHGHKASVHDYLTGTPGSFEKIMEAVKHAKEAGIRIRFNTVVNSLNYEGLEEIASLLYAQQIEAANFILFNPIIEARRYGRDMSVGYWRAGDILKRVIDNYKERIPKITVRYIPFCIMNGYEQYVTNLPQLQYDPDEWDYYLRTFFHNGWFVRRLALLAGLVFFPSYKRLKQLRDWNIIRHEALMRGLELANKVKGDVCRKCAYEKICDGLWRGYAEKKGFGELVPIIDLKITDPAHFLSKNPRFPPGIAVSSRKPTEGSDSK